MQKRDLFQSGKGGYATYRIPGIVATETGALLAFCEARKSPQGDWGTSDIHMRRSRDGRSRWSKRREIVNSEHFDVDSNPAAPRKGLSEDEGRTVHNPVPIADQETDEVHLLCCVEYAHCFYMRSDDKGKSFTEPCEITQVFEELRADYDWKVMATGPGHGVQLRSGRLVVPVWLSSGEGLHAHHPSVVSTIYSDDHGRTWHCGDIALRHGAETQQGSLERSRTHTLVNPSEAAVVQLRDGRVMLNVRNESPPNRRVVTYSSDGTTGWSVPAFDGELFDPVCSASLVRLTEQPDYSKDRILFANPDSRSEPAAFEGSAKRARRNLTLKLSYDEGSSWPVAKVVDSGISGYSDITVGPEKTIYCLYERGGFDGNMYETWTEYLTLAQLDIVELTGGKDCLQRSRADG